ncbi:MAG: glycosyltransferase family 4 protein [Gemmatimonadota bacterium]
MRLLGVFNAFDTANPGGVQVSGRLAWHALGETREFDARALLVSLEATSAPADPRIITGIGRLDSIAAARRARGDFDVALFWHLDLLKLLPFLRLGPHCRKIVFLHGVEAWRRRGTLTRRALARSALVLSNTAYTYQRALRANAELTGRKQRIVHLGVGAPLDEPTPTPAALPAAIMIARLHAQERYKGHDQVIAAWPGVVARVPGAQLWMVGDGDLSADLHAAAERAGVGDYVRFFGRATEPEKEALLRRARCLLLPSTGEGFGLVYLEAMRLGRPCLVGIDGGREVVNPPEAGFSVTHRTPQEITDAVVRLLTLNGEWHARSAAARARYEREYTAAEFGRRIVAAVREGAR